MSGFTHESAAAESVEWFTPAWVFEALRERDGSPMRFYLDPCHPMGEPLAWVPAARRYTLEDDGLSYTWRGRIWCNPPYGPETQRWLARMDEHRNGIALVFARTDAEWFHRYVVPADGVLFLRQRIKFVDRSGQPRQTLDKRTGKMRVGSPGAGSMLVAWGRECRWALIQASQAGLGTFADLS